MENDRLRVGVITSPHGVHGEVNVFPTTDDPNRFKKLKKCYIDLGKEIRPVEIDGVKFFKNMVILHFKGIDDRNEIEKLRQKDLLIDREDAVTLKKGENFICDLIGLNVITDEGNCIGELEDVIQTGANDVYSVKSPEGKEILIPVTKECVLDVLLDEKKVIVHLLPGLLDL